VPDSPALSDLPTPDAEAVLRLLQAATGVQRRHQFFGWVQANFRSLLPRALVSCGSYQRNQRSLSFDVFNSVVLSQQILSQFTNPQSELMRAATTTWLERGRRSIVFATEELASNGAIRRELEAAGLGQILVHGVSRPQRPNELESFFALAEPAYPMQPSNERYLEMLLPCLHSTYLRMQQTEQELGVKPPARPVAAPAPSPGLPLTGREKQILAGVRDGMSNAQIGTLLNISALTVKNHIQKILKKLGAANRAQAVAMATSQGALALVGLDLSRSTSDCFPAGACTASHLIV